MTLLKVFDIASSGMSAQSIRLNTTASNLANSDSVSGTSAGTYRARSPVFAATLENYRKGYAYDSDASIGVSVTEIVEKDGELEKEYRPEHPKANSEGFVYKTNVNPMEEMANMISASRSYQLNVEVTDAAKTLLQKTLNLGQ